MHSLESFTMTQIFSSSEAAGNDVNHLLRVEKRTRNCKLLMSILEGPLEPIVIDFTECLKISAERRKRKIKDTFAMSLSQAVSSVLDQPSPDKSEFSEPKRAKNSPSQTIKRVSKCQGIVKNKVSAEKKKNAQKVQYLGAIREEEETGLVRVHGPKLPVKSHTIVNDVTMMQSGDSPQKKAEPNNKNDFFDAFDVHFWPSACLNLLPAPEFDNLDALFENTEMSSMILLD